MIYGKSNAIKISQVNAKWNRVFSEVARKQVRLQGDSAAGDNLERKKCLTYLNTNQMRKVKFINFRLLLTIGMATVMFTSCSNKVKNPLTYDEGVVINGVKWATRNVAAPGTFTVNPEDVGMFYQWNCKVGWSTVNNCAVSSDGSNSWNSKWDGNDASTWEKSNDPSPSGWRVPTDIEIKKLFDKEKVTNEWITENGVNGSKFTDKVTGNSIFLPAAGILLFGYAELDGVGKSGAYWGSTRLKEHVIGAVVVMGVSVDHGANWGGAGEVSYGYSVRPVAN